MLIHRRIAIRTGPEIRSARIQYSSCQSSYFMPGSAGLTTREQVLKGRPQGIRLSLLGTLGPVVRPGLGTHFHCSLWRFYMGGAGVPSDHLSTGTKKMVSGSGTKRKGATTTGEPSRFAPQLAPSVFGM